MALKAAITADEFGKLPEVLQDHYVGDGDMYRLDAEGVEDVSGLKSALERQKAEARRAKDGSGELSRRLQQMEELLSGLGGEEGAQHLKELQSKLEKDDLLRAMANGDLESVSNRLLGRNNADWGKKYSALESKVAEAERALKERDQRLHRIIIEGEIQRAANGSLIPSAVEDAVTLGRLQWQLGDDGKPVMRNADGDLEMGKDAKPLTISEWLDGMRETRPHWFPGATGGGAGGGRPGGGQLNPDAVSNMSMPEYMAKRRSGEIK